MSAACAAVTLSLWFAMIFWIASVFSCVVMIEQIRLLSADDNTALHRVAGRLLVLVDESMQKRIESCSAFVKATADEVLS